MAKSKLKPVSISGIEFDALISEDRNFTQEIPDYPVEKGFNVSDTIILKPFEISLTLYIADIPLTWHKKQRKKGRVKQIIKKLEKLYFSRKLVKVVTQDYIYTNMGITSMSIKKSKELGNTREINISLKKVYQTKRKTVYIPKYLLKSGKTKKNAGKATTKKSSSSSSSKSSSSKSSKSNTKGSSSRQSNKGKSESKKAGSILYKATKGFGFW